MGGRQYQAGDRLYASTATAYRLVGLDPLVDGVASGVESSEYAVDGGAFARFLADFHLAEGIRAAAYRSRDRVENLEVTRSTAVHVDGTAPVSEVALSGPRFTAAPGDAQAVGGPLFVASHTLLDLPSQDPAANGVVSGLALRLLGLDGAALAPFAGPFVLVEEGPHGLAFRGRDNVANEEGLKSFAVSVDSTPPNTEVSFSGPHYLPVPGDGALPGQAQAFVGPGTRVVLTARDPASRGTASGVLQTRYRVDSGPWTVYAGPFLLTGEGLHAVEWLSADRVANEERPRMMRIALDGTTPVTTLSLGQPRFTAFGLDVLGPQTPVSLSAADPVSDGAAAGVARTTYRIDGGPLLEYATAFFLGQGTHQVEYGAEDRVANAEARRTVTLAVSDFQFGAVTGADALAGSGTADATGLLRSNGLADLSGSVRVEGDVTAGSVTLKGQATVTGNITQGAASLPGEPISIDVLIPLALARSSTALIPAEFLVGGELVVDAGRVLTLATGVYVVGGLRVNGGGSLAVSGRVELLVQGEVRVNGGGALNAAGRAADLAVFASTSLPVHFSGGARAVGLFYVPRGALEIAGDARLGGHFFGKTARLTGTSNTVQAGEVLPAEPPASEGGGSGGSGGKKGAAALADTAAAPAGALDPGFYLREVYSFPNPAVGGARPTLHVEVGVADRVTIRVYDIAGQPVHEATLDGPPAVINDGSGPQYAYEHAWEGHIPSGVYLYTVTAEKAGQGTIRKAGKLAVVR